MNETCDDGSPVLEVTPDDGQGQTAPLTAAQKAAATRRQRADWHRIYEHTKRGVGSAIAQLATVRVAVSSRLLSPDQVARELDAIGNYLCALFASNADE